MTEIQKSDIELPKVWYAGQRVARTIVQNLIVIVPIANGVAVAGKEYLEAQTDVVIPAWVFLALNGAIAITALLIGLVARLMAVPGFNSWLSRWLNLGSVPKSALEPVATASGVVVGVDVKPDPKVVVLADDRGTWRSRNAGDLG